MDIQFITEFIKGQLLTTKSHPPMFIVEREGVPIWKMDTLVLDSTIPTTDVQCFSVARYVAQENHWEIEKVKEICLITTEKTSDGKEHLIIAQCTPNPSPTMTERRIEIVRRAGNIALLDSSEAVSCNNSLLLSICIGIAGAALSDRHLLATIAALEALKDQ